MINYNYSYFQSFLLNDKTVLQRDHGSVEIVGGNIDELVLDIIAHPDADEGNFVQFALALPSRVLQLHSLKEHKEVNLNKNAALIMLKPTVLSGSLHVKMVDFHWYLINCNFDQIQVILHCVKQRFFSDSLSTVWKFVIPVIRAYVTCQILCFKSGQ